MTNTPNATFDDRSVTVRVPLKIRKRGGRKLVIAPDGAKRWSPPRPQVDSALIKALARAFRWRRLIDTGVYASVTEIAAAEKINQSYVCRILRLTLLAPAITEMILDGRQRAELDLDSLLKPLPTDWTGQAVMLLKAVRFVSDRLGHQGYLALCDHMVKGALKKSSTQG